MSRHFPDWLAAYVQYASFSEAPTRMHFWSGVSAIAGALRRRVWIDQAYFKWTPCFYIVLVAPPGIVSKSSTAAIAMSLLREVPGINFGPDVVTWPALVTAFSEHCEGIEFNGDYLNQSALTLESSEFGNLVNPQDREMVDLLVSLWDAKEGVFKKVTKGSGTDVIENPWINLIACTTPAWIAGNFPEYMIGGGFTSRCLFVYADRKRRLIAYPYLEVPKEHQAMRQRLLDDLVEISQVPLGPYELSKEAIEWGKLWYAAHYEKIPDELSDDRFGGYIARKQTHIHKLAMVIAAAQRNSMVIQAEDLQVAEKMVTDLEPDMAKVFSKIGRTEDSVQAERFIQYVQRMGEIDYASAYRYVHLHFPGVKSFEDLLAGAIRAGYVILKVDNGRQTLAKGPVEMSYKRVEDKK